MRTSGLKKCWLAIQTCNETFKILEIELCLPQMIQVTLFANISNSDGRLVRAFAFGVVDSGLIPS